MESRGRAANEWPHTALTGQSAVVVQWSKQSTDVFLTVVAVLLWLTAMSAQPAGNQIRFPSGFRSWFEVNSMIVAKDSPIFSQIGGMHIIYVNVDAIRDDLDTLVLDADLLEAVLSNPDPSKAKEIELKVGRWLRKHLGNPKFKELSERLDALKHFNK